MSDGVGRAKLDLGFSFGFLRAGPNRGRWPRAEGWDRGQYDHVSREALQLAWIWHCCQNPTLTGSSAPLPHGGYWAMTRALPPRKLAAAQARLPRKFL